MSQMNSRKYLLCLIYKVIFKEIYPIDVGNAIHADKINSYSKQRKLKGYNYDDYEFLRLHVDSAIDLPEFYFEINEGNFHNWMNGISSPKHLILINSILEYLIDSCKDKGKCDLLKDRVLKIIKSDEFNQYTGDLIKINVDAWIVKIENNDRETLFRATKEILYLLKNKDKFIPYLVRESQTNETIEKPAVEFVKCASDSHENTTYIIDDNTPISTKIIKKNYTKIKLVSITILVILMPLTFGIISLYKNSDIINNSIKTLANSPMKSANVFNTYKKQNNTIDNSSHETLFPAQNKSTSASNIPKNINPVTKLSPTPFIETKSTTQSYINLSAMDLLPPEIISPMNGIILPLSELEVQWKTVDPATSYSLTVTDTDIWEKVLTTHNIKGNSQILDKSLFKPGRSYRIYVQAAIGEELSKPNYIDINIEALLPPKILSPINGIIVPLSNISVQWEPVTSATGYTLVVTDTNKWENIFANYKIDTTSFELDKSLFEFGGDYRIYVSSAVDQDFTAPNYIDISIEDLASPVITNPANGNLLPLEDIKIQWEPVTSASSYSVTVTDTLSWTNIFSQLNVTDNYILIDKSLLKAGNYRIYLHSTNGSVLSEAAYIDIEIYK